MLLLLSTLLAAPAVEAPVVVAPRPPEPPPMVVVARRAPELAAGVAQALAVRVSDVVTVELADAPPPGAFIVGLEVSASARPKLSVSLTAPSGESIGAWPEVAAADASDEAAVRLA